MNRILIAFLSGKLDWVSGERGVTRGGGVSPLGARKREFAY